jgi:tRNA(fMet)-specific endonuclease VapC
MNYLLDTCVISDFFKKLPSVVKHFKEISPEKIHVSSITVMEIEYGLKLNKERDSKIRPLWSALLNHIQVVSYSPNCSIASASIRATLKNIGTSIGPYDVLIAGTALAENLIMVTSNASEFGRISELTFEDWRK